MWRTAGRETTEKAGDDLAARTAVQAHEIDAGGVGGDRQMERMDELGRVQTKKTGFGDRLVRGR